MKRHLYLEIECEIDLIRDTWTLIDRRAFALAAIKAAEAEIDNITAELDEEYQAELKRENVGPPVDDLKDIGLADYSYHGYAEART